MFLPLWHFLTQFGHDFPSATMSNTLTIVVYVKALFVSLMVIAPLALVFLGHSIIPIILILDFVAGTTLLQRYISLLEV
jgi:hypothetical protein